MAERPERELEQAVELGWRTLLVAQIAALKEAGGLTLTGGNLSLRLGQGFLITPRFASSQRHWKLTPDDLVAVELGREAEALARGEASREVLMHGEIYCRLGEVKAICHTHATASLTFAVEGRPIPLVGEYRRLFAHPEVPLTQSFPSQSRQLAEEVAQVLERQWEAGSVAAACLIPDHGLVVAVADAKLLASLVMAVEQAAGVELGRKRLRG